MTHAEKTSICEPQKPGVLAEETPENDGGMAAAAGSIWADTSWEDSD